MIAARCGRADVSRAGRLARPAGARTARTRARRAARPCSSRPWRRSTAATPSVCAALRFAVASLLRSRRHLLVLATYFGVAIAICLASILLIEVRGTFAVNTPAEWVLALPLVFMFFLCPRACARASGSRRRSRPTGHSGSRNRRLADLRQRRGARHAHAGSPADRGRHDCYRSRPSGRSASVVTAAAADARRLVLVEFVLLRWSKVPFACAHAPSPDVLKSWWPVYIVAMYVYAFQAVRLAGRGSDLVARADLVPGGGRRRDRRRARDAISAVTASSTRIRRPSLPLSGAAEPVRGAQLTLLSGEL